MQKEKEILFEEVQKFSPWLTVVLISSLALAPGIMAIALSKQDIETGKKFLWILIRSMKKSD